MAIADDHRQGITCDRRTYRNVTQAVDIVRDLLDSRSDAETADYLNSLDFIIGN
ncbi:hypothetical protein ABZ923_19535 [Streptomyces sp. NPDC046881]|uniref:hypothetical protein n=1 Tax=Streptomyces sp. NPDC046881 TaxID=3155374 RepID=UPI0033E30B1E